MRVPIGICATAALLAAALLLESPAAFAASFTPVADTAHTAHTADIAPSTDLSARRRADRSIRKHRRAFRASKRPAYSARPSYDRPGGMAPFFPFHHGYGLEPSW
uniref:Uncharacterized protein n=1 Tax=Rhodopseudomonas palustris (strain BisA53) TaxID=316055 RepID=Q07UT9_RHOP5